MPQPHSDRSGPSARAKISSLFHVRPGFLRSVNVALDYDDPHSSRDYVVTGFGAELFRRLAPALRAHSSERAWRLTGDYGSGKSAFALCFARIAAGEKGQLPPELRQFIPSGRRLEPVLVCGTPEPLEASIRKGLAALRQRVFRKVPKALERVEPGITGLLALIDAHGEALRQERLADGLVLVLDELGQNLRHAAIHSAGEDISLLQLLGERADRSGAKPLVVLAMLHQGLSTYSADLDVAARREWEKVAGRFKEIVFAQPTEQVITLVTEMLGIRVPDLPPSARQHAEKAMRQATHVGLYGAAPAEKFLIAIAPRLYPLHPTVFPVLVKLLRRFGQNERSLVGFLSSHEPHGFREFADARGIGSHFYQLSHLYDYFKANLAGGLLNGHAAQWEVIDAAVAQARDSGDTDLAVLKSIGLLNLINDPSLVATEGLLRAAVDAPDTPATIHRLHKDASIIHERGHARGFALWPHSSVNLDAALEQADTALAHQSVTARTIAAMLPLRSVVARRHYIETGNLRHFSVHYLDLASFRDGLKTKLPETVGADGQIHVVVTNDAREVAEAVTLITGPRSPLGPLVFVGISSPATRGIDIVRELNRWHWIQKNLRELTGDNYARAHVQREIKRGRNALEKELDHLVQLRSGEGGTLAWYEQRGALAGAAARSIVRHLSTRCTEEFSECPRVANELINRRVTSSAASRARSLLIEAIATAGDRENLGFDPDKNPPEFAIYLSVIKAGRLHVKTRDGWRFRTVAELRSDDPLRLAPSLQRIHELLVKADVGRCSVPVLFAALRVAPYGVRDGFLPLLLAVYLAGQWDQTAIYEDGTFVEKPGSNLFQRLTKEPEAFHLQHCSVRGVRRELINEVATVLDFAASERPEVLQIVRPLMQFVGRLPEYSLLTDRQLSAATRRVRAEFLKAREPATLLFDALPRALGFPSFLAETTRATVADARRFSEELDACVIDLRESYARLVQRVGDAILAAFHFEGTVPEFRAQFASRLTAVRHALTDRELKVFADRVGDPGLLDLAWTESVATYVANKAPERWRDSDEDEFHQRLVAFASRFERTEAVGFNGKAVAPEKLGRAVRFTLTRPTGHEVDRVIHWTPRDDATVEKAKDELKRLLARHGAAGMAAAAQFVWETLESEKSRAPDHG
ncbi:hypothetical protein [Oleiharenicola sp. Vm1]|uniref:hypothetical protein n=1 Tax=Oleiharenicola sp. Vm1 TaxID=3398393 RepID=UPI0039F5D977